MEIRYLLAASKTRKAAQVTRRVQACACNLKTGRQSSRGVIVAAAAAAVLTLSATAFAQLDHGTADEAKAMLTKAAAALKADKAKTLDLINEGKGGYLDRDLSVLLQHQRRQERCGRQPQFKANIGDGCEDN